MIWFFLIDKLIDNLMIEALNRDKKDNQSTRRLLFKAFANGQ